MLSLSIHQILYLFRYISEFILLFHWSLFLFMYQYYILFNIDFVIHFIIYRLSSQPLLDQLWKKSRWNMRIFTTVSKMFRYMWKWLTSFQYGKFSFCLLVKKYCILVAMLTPRLFYSGVSLWTDHFFMLCFHIMFWQVMLIFGLVFH